MVDPDDVLCAGSSHAVHDIAVSLFIKIGSGIDAFGEFLTAAVEVAGPREPVAVHFEPPRDKDRASEGFCLCGPIVNISIPFSSNDRLEGKAIGPSPLDVGSVPRRPIDEGTGVVADDDFQVVKGKRLFSPIAR